MGQWSFIKNVIKEANAARKNAKIKKAFGPQLSKPKENVYNNFRNHMANEIKKEKSFRKKAGKEFNSRNNDLSAELMGESVYEPITEGRTSRAYIKHNLYDLQKYREGKLNNIKKEYFDKEFSN